MSDMDITVYTLPNCPNCDELKGLLRDAGIEFTHRDIEDEDNYTELLIDGCPYVEAPIVRINGQFYDALGAARVIGLRPGGKCQGGNCSF